MNDVNRIVFIAEHLHEVKMNRQRRWAKFERIRLKKKLGSRCSKCRKRKHFPNLEFDCIEPRGDLHHKWELNRRVCFYRKQLKENNLQLLCKDCHKVKTRTDVETPF